MIRKTMSTALTQLLRECVTCFPLPVGVTRLSTPPNTPPPSGECGASDIDPSATQQRSLSKLMDRMQSICCDDLGLKPVHPITGAGTLTPPHLAMSPVTYMAIQDTSSFTVGIFLLKKDKTIPLHDHPGMTGLVRVLYGTLNVTSFNHCGTPLGSGLSPGHIVDPDLIPKEGGDSVIPVIKNADCSLTSESPVCVLTPNDANFHQISAVSGPAAFLDILAPPYDDIVRCCNYYHQLPPADIGGSPEQEQNGGTAWLQTIPQPSEFWCYQEPYVGPSLP